VIANNSAALTGRLFFFTRRRRHTRLQGDWSSDVCSSDLVLAAEGIRFTILALHLVRRENREADALGGQHVERLVVHSRLGQPHEIGRASCRDRAALTGRSTPLLMTYVISTPSMMRQAC